MAAACQIDRSMLYRIINGKRNPPSPEIFFRISKYLQLAPAEYEQLLNAYELTRLGASIYYKRKNVEDFFIRFPSHLAMGNIQPLFHKAAFSPDLPSSQTACVPIFLRQSSTTISMGFSFWKQQRKRALSNFLYSRTVPFCLVCSQACVCTAP